MDSKSILFVVILFLLVSSCLNPYEWHLVNAANLAIHETGHMLTMFFGTFVNIFGGSLFQVLVPLVFAFYFFITKQTFAASLCIMWAGQSLHNVGIYAGDAIDMDLPLVGGDGVIHDWNYLLSTLGLLPYTETIGKTIRAIGLLILFVGSIFAGREIVKK